MNEYMEKYLGYGGSRGGAQGPGSPLSPAYFQTKLSPEGPYFASQPTTFIHSKTICFYLP